MPFDPSKDQHQSVHRVVQQVLKDPEFPKLPVERLEISCLANGDSTWRARRAGEEDTVGGVYENPDMPRE